MTDTHKQPEPTVEQIKEAFRRKIIRLQNLHAEQLAAATESLADTQGLFEDQRAIANAQAARANKLEQQLAEARSKIADLEGG